MDNKQKAVARAAVLIHECHGRHGFSVNSVGLPEHTWANLQQLKRRVQRAQEHGWLRAAESLACELADALRRFQREVAVVVSTAEQCTKPSHWPSPGEICSDILALDGEFAAVEVVLADHVISVTTDCIVLEDIRLGAFEIRLDWQALGHSAQPYRVVALDPNPAARDESVTHPHVQDERLCEGEGRTAIAAALAECRLHDLFLLVSRVLHTYARGSAYIELDHWLGVACEDCGACVDEEDRSYCTACEQTMCGSCSSSCARCGEAYCCNCLHFCAACGYEYCSACVKVCSQCRRPFCEDCREENLCRACHDKAQEEEPSDDEDDESHETDPVASDEEVPAAAG